MGYMTLKQAGAFAGVSEWTIRRAIADGKLRAYKPRGKWLVQQSAVIAWVEGKRR